MNNRIGALADLVLISAALLVTNVSVAAAQTVSWQVDTGRDTVALRDIARTGKPLDASPVEWRGDGPGLVLRHAREKGHRLHTFDLSVTRASHFALKSPLESFPRPKGDALSAVGIRYEYRRYLFSNVLVHGFDLGAAAQGGASRTHLTQHIDGDLELTESRIAFRTALAAVARYRRSRFGLEAVWANGGHIDHATERHTAEGSLKSSRSGGGWLTDLTVAASVGISSHTSVAIRYVSTDEALMSSHRNFTTARRSWNVGIIYAK